MGYKYLKQRGFSAALKLPVAVPIILALLIAGGLFFWYEYRPSIVRAKCSAEAEKKANKDEYVYEIVYRHCLRSHGIEYTDQKE